MKSRHLMQRPRIEPTRRRFLMGLGGFAVGAELAANLPGRAFAKELVGAYCPPPSAWSDLAKMMTGPVLRPDDPFFADYCRPNNLRYVATLPQGIARCASDQDVAACIKWVRGMGLPFAIRSGGHNYAGYSTTPGLLIDMTLMADSTAGAGGLVVVPGGAINSHVYLQLERLGRTITHGRCDSVGAAGFLLGGGIGFNMRKFGMASDLMRATTVVTAEGEVVKADDGHDAALLWACRGGGGGNFGVSTAFTLQTFPVDAVTVFELTWTRDMPKTLHSLLHHLASAPDEFGSKISVTIPSRQQRCDGVGTQISILGQLHPQSKTLKEIIGPAWDTATTRVVKEDVPYWQGQDFLAETTFPYYYQEKSSYIHAADITEEAVLAMFDGASRNPGTAMPQAFKFFQVGGAIDKTAPTATAYVHRGYDWLFSVEANWWRPTDPTPLVEENLDWQAKFYADVNQRTKAVGAFQNFPDPTLADWRGAYYGENFRRLTEVKKAVDPTSLFTYAQAIPPA